MGKRGSVVQIINDFSEFSTVDFTIICHYVTDIHMCYVLKHIDQ